MPNQNVECKEPTEAELERWRKNYLRSHVVWPLIILCPYCVLCGSIVLLVWEVVCTFYPYLIMIAVSWGITQAIERNSTKIMKMIDGKKEE